MAVELISLNIDIISFIIGGTLGLITYSKGKLVYKTIDLIGLVVVLLVVIVFIPLPPIPLPADQITPEVIGVLMWLEVVMPYFLGDIVCSMVYFFWLLRKNQK
jgi:hypothetical protein